jgi:hypothetical protein
MLCEVTVSGAHGQDLGSDCRQCPLYLKAFIRPEGTIGID